MIVSGRKSSPDDRDFIYRARPKGVLNLPLPRQVDRSGSLPPCWDQGPIGSCEAHAGAAKLYELYPGYVASRIAIHYIGRKMEDTIGQDVGIETRDLMKVLQAGVLPENVWPYDISKANTSPPNGFDLRMVGTYQRIQGADDLLNHLAHDGCVVLSFNCPDTITTGDFPAGTARWRSLGWHCVLAVGYDIDYVDIDIQGKLLCRNSWGPEWNPPMRGHFWLPIDWAVRPASGDDMWAATLAPPGTVAGVEIEGAPV